LGSDLGGAVKGFKDGMKDGTAADDDAPAQVAQTPPAAAKTSETIDVDAKTKS